MNPARLGVILGFSPMPRATSRSMSLSLACVLMFLAASASRPPLLSILDRNRSRTSAGSFITAVVSTLWPVVDLSTALLLVRFYGHLLGGGQDPASALRGAQAWLREATAAEMDLAGRFERLYTASGRRDAGALRWMRHFRAQPEARPFAHPYYWAAFVFSGI